MCCKYFFLLKNCVTSPRATHIESAEWIISESHSWFGILKIPTSIAQRMAWDGWGTRVSQCALLVQKWKEEKVSLSPPRSSMVRNRRCLILQKIYIKYFLTHSSCDLIYISCRYHRAHIFYSAFHFKNKFLIDRNEIDTFLYLREAIYWLSSALISIYIFLLFVREPYAVSFIMGENLAKWNANRINGA